MLIIFSDRKSPVEDEICEILMNCKVNVITQNRIIMDCGKFTAAVIRSHTELKTTRFASIILNIGDNAKMPIADSALAICDGDDKSVLDTLCRTKIPVVSCGMCAKNSITLSAFDDKSAMISIQRSFCDIFSKNVPAGEYRIALSKPYSPFAVMACTAALLFHEVIPGKF